jgi:chromosome segregation ATPase
MSNATDAADFIERQAVLAQGFVDAAAALRRIGSLELAAKEAASARATEEAAVAALQAEMAEATAALQAAKASAKKMFEDASAKAKNKAAEIIAAANDEARRIVDSAMTNLAHAKAEAETEANKLASHIEDSIRVLGKVTDDLAAKKQELQDADTELARVVTEIAAMKAKFA